MIKYLTAITIIILATLLVTDHIKKDKARDLKYLQEQNDLQQQLEQETRRLERSEVTRSSYRRAIDSLSTIITDRNSKLLEKDKEIANIKGRYKNVPVDSLGTIMEQRASRRRTD